MQPQTDPAQTPSLVMTSDTPPHTHPRVWIFGLLIPFIYLVVEFSLSHRLLEVLDETVTDEVLNGLEFWGRVISGLGLGLLLHRLAALRLGNTVLGLCASLAVGVLVMWNVQKSLLDHLVESADAQDKRAAMALAWIAPQVPAGQLQTLQGDPVLMAPMAQGSGVQSSAVKAMFPAAALHMQQRDEQLARWLPGSEPAARLAALPPALADNAYKNLIVPPVAIGLSLFFALVNLSAVVSFAVGMFRPRWRAAVMAGCLVTFVAVSLAPTSALLDSTGYRNALRPGLWQEKPALAVLVEWTCQATRSWGEVAAFVHQHLGFHVRFGSVPRT